MEKYPISDLERNEGRAEWVMNSVCNGRIPIFKTANRVILGGKEHIVVSVIDITERKQL